MTVNYNVTGPDRKKLVAAISQVLDAPANYLGAPGFQYQVGDYTIDKTGAVTGPELFGLLTALAKRGFVAATEECEAPVAETLEPAPVAPDTAPETAAPAAATEPDQVVIDIPLEGFTPEAVDNLCKLVASKEVLIKKALSAEALPIQVLEDRISFPWFIATDGEHITAYAQFITCLAETAKTKKRVTAKAQESFENEKFALRVWLLGLGMIGKKFSLVRKLLLANLGGNSSWLHGPPDKAAPAPAEGDAAPDETAGVPAPASVEDVPAEEPVEKRDGEDA